VYALDELPWQTDRQAMQQLIELARFDWGAAWREADWRFIDEHLQRMVTTCRENSLPLLVMTWPSRYQAQAVFVEDQPQQWMAQRSERWGFAHLDLLACLRAMRPEGPAFYDACHVDAVTNDAVGFVLAHALAVGGGEPFRAVEPADAPKSAGACLWASAMMGRGSDPYLTRALALAKQDYATLFDLGRVLVRYDRAADARPFFEAAVAQDPQRIAARMNLAVSLTEAGQFEAAVEQLNHAATLKPDAAGIHNETGIVRMRQQRWTDAAEAFRRALAIDPQYAPARDNLEQIKRRLEMQSD
jgi:tetratricopeptide (TPR) repeat protein